jgi:hypothetical protein
VRRSVLAIAAAVAGLACVKDHPCRENTVMVDIGFADSHDRVDGVELRYSLDDAPMLPLKTIVRPAGVDHDRLELEVKNYATHQKVVLQYAPLLASAVVGAWQDQSVPLLPGCTTAKLIVMIGSNDAGLIDTSEPTPDALLPLDRAGADAPHAIDSSERDLRGQTDLHDTGEVGVGGQDTSADQPRGSGGAGGTTSTGGVGSNGTGGASATGGSGTSAAGGSGGSPATGGSGGSTVVVDAAMDTLESPTDLPLTSADTSDSAPSDTVDAPSCVASVGIACGSCGGRIACDGSCNVPTPSNYGATCGSCGGTITCASTCSIATPSNFGATCSSCGGTFQCDGTCNIATPSNLGQSCVYTCMCFFGRMPVDGTIGCTDQCEDSASRCGPSCTGQ